MKSDYLRLAEAAEQALAEQDGNFDSIGNQSIDRNSLSSEETCSFKEFKRFAKQLGYKISSSIISFGGFGYGCARFYKIFMGDRRVYPLNPKYKDEYVQGWWEKAMSMDKELQEFILSHKIIDDIYDCKCIPSP